MNIIFSITLLQEIIKSLVFCLPFFIDKYTYSLCYLLICISLTFSSEANKEISENLIWLSLHYQSWMIKSDDALIDSSGCFLILLCYKELARANTVRVRAPRASVGLTIMPCQISLGMPHTHGTGTHAMSWSPECDPGPDHAFASSPATGLVDCCWTDPGPDLTPGHAQCTALPITY